jgi:hypothetical protein
MAAIDSAERHDSRSASRRLWDPAGRQAIAARIGLRQVRWRKILEKIAVRTTLQRPGYEGIIVNCPKHRHVGEIAPDMNRRRHPIDYRHTHIHQDHI